MNFMVYAFWTDGLGLRQYDCGSYIKLKYIIDMAEDENSD